jgi:hypothetical protein
MMRGGGQRDERARSYCSPVTLVDFSILWNSTTTAFGETKAAVLGTPHPWAGHGDDFVGWNALDGWSYPRVELHL